MFTGISDLSKNKAHRKGEKMSNKNDPTKPDEVIVKQEPERLGYIDTTSLTEKRTKPSNTVLKGSKITGDINVSCDLDVSGEIHGNITSDGDANIHIQGVCMGSVHTKQGNIIISGQLSKGDIVSGGTVTLTGSFKGGLIQAKEKISINGEFEGKLESKEVEVGAETVGKGEIIYGEFVSIARGAKIEATVTHRAQNGVAEKKAKDINVARKSPTSGTTAVKDDNSHESPAEKENLSLPK
jgi:cytoskeletal protein CcmA (bactofilin family)